jgi:hypothetical protein
MTAAKTPTAEEQQAAVEGRVEVGEGPEIPSPVVPAEQTVVLHGIRWETYEGLLKDMENSRTPRSFRAAPTMSRRKAPSCRA